MVDEFVEKPRPVIELTLGIPVVDVFVHPRMDGALGDVSHDSVTHRALLLVIEIRSATSLRTPDFPRHLVKTHAAKALDGNEAAVGQREAFTSDEVGDDIGDKDLAGLGPVADL